MFRCVQRRARANTRLICQRLGSYSISDIQDFFEFIIKKHETLIENLPIQIYPNKIKNTIILKIKTGYKLELLTPEIMRLLGSTKKDVDSDKNSENLPKLESVEVVLVHCNLVKNDYQHTSKVLFSFVLNKQLGQLINTSPHSLPVMNTVNTEFNFAEVCFTDQASKALEIEDNVCQCDTNYCVDIIKMRYSREPRFRKYVKGYGFLSFARKFGNKYSKELMDTATKTGIDAAKMGSKRVVQKTAEATGDLIGNKLADKITSIGKPREKEKTKEIEEIYIPSEKRQQIVDDLRLF